MRLDQLLVDRGLAPNRSRARAVILAGRVWSDGTRLDKAGTGVSEDVPLEVRPGRRYVSRSGQKLAGVLPLFGIEVRGREALDVGASTGGFTQVLLEAGAERVIALDVGRGQLDYGLRRDPRVHPVENLNARYLRPEDLPFVPNLCVVDVSFISLKQVLPAVVPCVADPREIVALVKPQFEVGRADVGRGGIVRDPQLHCRVLLELADHARQAGWGVAGVAASDLPGAEGNVEFFLHLRGAGPGLDRASVARRIREVVPGAPVEPEDGS